MSYVEQELKRGVSEPAVKKALRDAGWADNLVEEAFLAARPPALPVPPESSGPFPAQGMPAQGNIAETGTESGPGNEPAAKKSKKPIIISVSAFLGLALLVLAGIWLFSGSVPPEDSVIVEDNSGQPEETTPAPENGQIPAEPADQSGLAGQPAATGGNGAAPEGSIAAENAATGETTPGEQTAATPSPDSAESRDAQRVKDMQALAEAQTTFSQLTEGNKYYTCGLAGGDCKGKSYGYPSQIGSILTTTPQDPLLGQSGTKPACGKDYVYCGLNNAPYPQFFCYYAKLEAGGYYTASQGGNFKRSAVPKVFEECAVAN